MTNHKRNINLDLIRIFAFLGVVGIHFFLNSGFYQVQITNSKHLLTIMVRTFFSYCVPFFIILSGYLMSQKKITTNYYKGILKTLLVYVLISIVLIIYNNLYHSTGYSITDSFFMILSFDAARYSWYIEMYIGLFLIIPYLNLVYNGLQSKEQKIGLICVGLFLTSLPLFLNSHNYRSLSWWGMPSQSSEYQQILPNYWTIIYPIVYYFIGCYINEFRPKMKSITNLLYIIITTILFGLYNYYRSFGSTYVNGDFQSWESPFTVVLSVLLFIYFLNLDTSKVSLRSRRLIIIFSNATLGAYLVSSMFDDYFYSILNASITNFNVKIVMIVVMVPLVFLSSLLFSILLNYFIRTIKQLYKKMRI
ncbi:MAG: acyltransferase family protein [Erysipelothrix sp.]